MNSRSSDCHVTVVGAGPYGLSPAAYLRAAGVEARVFGAQLHYFTKETALRTLTDVGYKLVDYFYTPRCIELGDLLIQKIVRISKKLSFTAFPDLTVRVLGGGSLLVLAE